MEVFPEEVLAFWMGGDQREQYHRKWFCSNRKEQAAVDEEIAGKYAETLRGAVEGELDASWQKTPKDKLALILVVDQFSRHIYRHMSLVDDDELRKKADEKALQLASELTSSAFWDSSFSTAERVFALMPFRHNATVQGLKYVMSSIDDQEAKIEWEGELLSRFRKQTLRRLQTLEDHTAAKNADSILEREQFDADESDMVSDELVVAVDSFLKEVLPSREGDGQSLAPVAISLSGGVDSMVICKILSKLKTAGGVVAIHIDYANRDESGDEAGYVEQYCRQLGNVSFHKRVVSEVTRGVTDRTEYEVVSREARYNFYKEIMASTGCMGVIFGHHEGDVQENVLSNVMRGCSPLYLSGMEAVGLTNGVPVWRPLLKFKKDSIYRFAHKYGVPYFRDTTPSWSTRGKLRTQLLPLLVDMYGQGCLKNLANLALASDQNRDLMRVNLYGPFADTVRRYDAGLRVQVKPYRSQPHTFWREALKELMHSLSLSLVRDKAVSVFMERIQPSPSTGAGAGAGGADAEEEALSGPFGWLELRKSFCVHLAASGVLTVFRPSVFLQTGDLLQEPGEESKDPSQSQQYRSFPLDAVEEWGRGLRVGHWQIRAQWVPSDDGGEDAKVLTEVHALLEGSFDYTLTLAPTCTALTFLQARAGGRKKSGQKPPAALVEMDLRIREALPLLVPVLTMDGDEGNEIEGGGAVKMERFLRLCFSYKR